MQILPGMGETVIYQKYQEQLTSNLLYVLHKHLIYGLGEPVNPKLDVLDNVYMGEESGYIQS